MSILSKVNNDPIIRARNMHSSDPFLLSKSVFPNKLIQGGHPRIGIIFIYLFNLHLLSIIVKY